MKAMKTPDPELVTVGKGGALTHTNRYGDKYYLHEGKTKTGKVRYFAAKKIGEGAMSAMPEGFEFAETINGVVSVRRIQEKLIQDADVDVVRRELSRHAHLAAHRVEVRGREIIVYESDRARLAEDFLPLSAGFPGFANGFGQGRLAELAASGSYSPVMKFVLSKDGNGWSAHRMTYRGEGGWSWPLETGPLPKLVKKVLRHVGTAEFYDLF